MQAAMTSLLSLLTPGPTAGGASADHAATPAGDFQSLLSFASNPETLSEQADALPQLLTKVLPLLKDLAAAVNELSALAENPDLPPELAQVLDTTVASLTGLIEAVQASAPEGDLPDLDIKSLSLPDSVAELDQETPPVALGLAVAPSVVLQAIQLTVKGAISVIENTDGAADFVPPAQVSTLAAVAAKLQAVLRPRPVGQHPVALSPTVDAMADVPVANNPGVPAATAPVASTTTTPVSLTDPAAGAALPSAPGRSTEVYQPVPAAPPAGGGSAQMLQVELAPDAEIAGGATGSVSPVSGLIEIPREMVQVVPQETASIVQAARDILEPAPHAQSQQAARPDAPQAKFTQAVVGQLRSVEFQEGTTKVELNPRGLGSIEVGNRDIMWSSW